MLCYRPVISPERAHSHGLSGTLSISSLRSVGLDWTVAYTVHFTAGSSVKESETHYFSTYNKFQGSQMSALLVDCNHRDVLEAWDNASAISPAG